MVPDFSKIDLQRVIEAQKHSEALRSIYGWNQLFKLYHYLTLDSPEIVGFDKLNANSSDSRAQNFFQKLF